MQKLLQNNLGLRSSIYYMLICALIGCISVFFILYDMIIKRGLSGESIDVSLIILIIFSSLLIISVTISMTPPLYFYIYFQKEKLEYNLLKLFAHLPIINIFCFFMMAFITRELDSENSKGPGNNSFTLFLGFAVFTIGNVLLHFNKAFHTIFRNTIVYVNNKTGYASKGKPKHYDFINTVDQKCELSRSVENPNEELIKRAEELINSATQYEVEPIGNVNLNIVIYVYGDGFDYCLLDSGWDIPFLFGDEDPEAVLADCHFLQINHVLYFRVDQVYVFNFEDNYVILNPAVDRNLNNIRSKRVKEKLDSYRVKGKPAGYFYIHPNLSDNLRISVNRYMNDSFDS